MECNENVNGQIKSNTLLGIMLQICLETLKQLLKIVKRSLNHG